MSRCCRPASYGKQQRTHTEYTDVNRTAVTTLPLNAATTLPLNAATTLPLNAAMTLPLQRCRYDTAAKCCYDTAATSLRLLLNSNSFRCYAFNISWIRVLEELIVKKFRSFDGIPKSTATFKRTLQELFCECACYFVRFRGVPIIIRKIRFCSPLAFFLPFRVSAFM